MDRIYERIVADHYKQYRQMLLLSGPRQVGKTTLSIAAEKLAPQHIYLNWDFEEDQMLILLGPSAVVERFKLNQIKKRKAILALDEIHKYKDWRNYMKGFYDKYHEQIHFILTGSAKLDVFRQTGDSLMGRYFSYRIHPLSVAELIDTRIPASEIRKPKKLDKQHWNRLMRFGGFPEPFSRGEARFYQRWAKLRSQQLFEDDIRDLTRIQEMAQLKLMTRLLQDQVGNLINYSELAKKTKVTVVTIQSWIHMLSSFYHCFTIQPWTKNVTRSLLKQPKLYLWDWSLVSDEGARLENMVASHLLKAVHFWTDHGFGEYELYFVRDKSKREVDFLVTKDNEPWFLVEVKKSSNQSISEHLYQFQAQIGAKHAFQVAFDLDYVDKDCFSYSQPIIVPALTFLSQLI